MVSSSAVGLDWVARYLIYLAAIGGIVAVLICKSTKLGEEPLVVRQQVFKAGWKLETY